MRLLLTSLVLAWPLIAEEVPASAPASTPEETEEVVESAPAPEIKAPPEAAPEAAEKTAEASKPAPEPVTLQNSTFEKFTLGGSFQLRGYYHDFTAESDLKKSLSFSLSKFRLDLAGAYNEHLGLLGQFQVEGNGKNFGVEAVYAYYKQGAFQLAAGKIKKAFSMEALQSSTTLYTVDRGQLYSTFLHKTNGYAGYDLGVGLKGGFMDEGSEVTYEAGVFNGKQGDAGGYANAQLEEKDKGFKAKDFAGRLGYKGLGGLEAEFAFSTKTAENLASAGNLDFAADAAYEAGLAMQIGGLRAQGEVSWGSNHNGLDSLIVDGSSEYLAFYGMLVWRREYGHGCASETVLKFEGLDPDMTIGAGGGAPNDGKFRYTVGANYFFTPKVSLLLNYGILQPVTKVVGEDKLTQDVDLLWRLNF